MKAKLQGMSSAATKVFEVVPIQTAWSQNEIYRTLNEITRSTMDTHIFRGCLNTLKEAGLIREPSRGHFQKIAIKEKKVKDMTSPEPKTAPLALPTKTTEPGQPKANNPLDLLSDIAGKLRAVADDIDAAAIAIDESIAESTENLGKLKQLQSILKSLS
jgi:hypothetical protein